MVVVGGLVLLFAIAELTLFSIIKYRLKNLEVWTNNVKAYYLLESAASVAVKDMGRGRIGTTGEKWTERDVPIPLGGDTFNVHYKVSKSAGQWFVTTSINSPKLGNRTYHLRLGGLRAFPIFIRGRP